MSGTQSEPTNPAPATTAPRGDDRPINPITGEPYGISELLERRAAGTPDTPATAPEVPGAEDAAAAELARWKSQAQQQQQRADAEATARMRAEQQAMSFQQQATDTGFAAVSTALEAAQARAANLQVQMKAAGEESDFAKVSELALEIGRLGGEIQDLERGKQTYERDRQMRIEAPPVSVPVVANPTERGILAELGVPSRDVFLGQRTPQTRTFLSAHPDFFTDRATYDKVMRGHSVALGQGYAPDSSEYFAAIDKELTMANSQPPPRQQEQHGSVPPSTPPSREGVSPTGRQQSRGGDVYVSPEQLRAAQWMGVDPADYAKEEAALRTRGELPLRRR